jgi:DNA-binding transcriptional LysR family regulator
MIDFNLEYYRAFYYVAQLGSVSKAAEALFLSQPAITRSIQQLEKRLGCKLFARVSRGMQMTSEGRTLFEHVDRAFGELITAEKTLRLMANFESGILNIGATETALHHFLLPIIEDFRKTYPQVFINVSGSSTPEMVRMLHEGKVELAVGVSPIKKADDLVITPATEFRDVFVAGPLLMEKENLRGRVLTAKEICELPLVVVEKGTSARGHIDLWFKEQGAFFKPDYSVRTSSMVLPFVQRNLAIGIVPDLFTRELLAQQAIFEVSVDKSIPERQVVIIHEELSQTTSLCRHFIDFINRRGG